MRAPLVLLLAVLPAIAQDLPVMRGTLLRRDPGVSSGELVLRDADGRLYHYRFDALTYVERENRPIDPSGLRSGDPIEIVSERLPGASLRSARSIHVLSPALPARHRTASAPERPAGDLTFSGLILHVSSARLILRPREGADQEILLSADTRCSDSGQAVDVARLRANMRVFVRAARDVSGKIEAREVVWGSVLSPK